MADFGIVSGPALAAAAVSAAAAVAGTVITTVASSQAAKANARASEEEEKALKYQTDREQASERKHNLAVLGAQEARIGASGLSSSSGSPMDLMLQSAFEGEMNALDIGYSGGLKQKAKRREAAMYRAQVPGIVIGGALQGVGQASGALGNYYARNNMGLGAKVKT